MIVYSQEPPEEPSGCCTNPAAIDWGDMCYEYEGDPVTLGDCCPEGSASDCESSYFQEGISCGDVPVCQGGCCCPTPSPKRGGTYRTDSSNCPGGFYAADLDCLECPKYECSDGADNDENGCADYQFDNACTGSDDDSEDSGLEASCNDPCSVSGYVPEIEELEVTPIAEGGINRQGFALSWAEKCTHTGNFEVRRCEGNYQECCGDATPENCLSASDYTAKFSTAIGTPSAASAEDSSDSLKFSQDYTYSVTANYGRPSVPGIKTANLGDLECWYRRDQDHVCVDSEYYLQYRPYLTSKDPHFSGATPANFLSRVGSSETYQPKLETRMKCQNRNLEPVEPQCGGDSVCVTSIAAGGLSTSQCVERSQCDNAAANPFQMFYSTRTDCESAPFCFWDRSYTVANNCFACQANAKCTDYKSQDACTSNNCGIRGVCGWKSTNDALGSGVCVNKMEYNCNSCNTDGSGNTDNTDLSSSPDSHNNIFDVCTQAKSDKLSVRLEDAPSDDKEKLCYYKEGISKNCNEVACTEYVRDSADCIATVTLNDDNSIQDSTRTDACKFGACRRLAADSNLCHKDADGDNTRDCQEGDNDCEKDLSPPSTEITVVPNDGSDRFIDIELTEFDPYGNTYQVSNFDDYKIYLCVVESSVTGNTHCDDSHGDYPFVTKKRLDIIGRRIQEGTRVVLLFPSEGIYNIKYYARDPHNNLEVIDPDNSKTVRIFPSENNGPIISSITVKEGGTIKEKDDGNIIYTMNPEKIRVIFGGEPDVEVELEELSVIKSATSPQTFPITVPSDNNVREHDAPFEFDLPAEIRNQAANTEETYTISLDAHFVRSDIGMRDANKCESAGICPGIIIDKKAPVLTIKAGGNGGRDLTQTPMVILDVEDVTADATIRNSNVAITLAFDETTVDLSTVRIQKVGGDFLNARNPSDTELNNLVPDFTQSGNDFTASYDLSDG
ncbi:hypothetical protein HYX09_02195, partial [Candidatus Woesearchaeota archaeon]|nr:hypothetical protein [Candidatus Woesearchaeota archaeon]